MGGLVRIVDDLNVNQRRGQFRVPLERIAGMRRWLKRLQDTETPLVVKEEDYFLSGIERKLHASRRIVTERLARQGLLRPASSDDFDYCDALAREPVSTLSLAQTISWVYHRPIQDVFVSERTLRKMKFSSARKQVKHLFNAYTGCLWLERIVRKQRRWDIVKPPKVKPWQRISRYDLKTWFNLSMRDTGGIQKLIKKGLLLPQGDSWTSKSLHNLVDSEGLAQLVALFHGVDIADILENNEDAYLDDLARSYFSNRLLPFMNRYNINFNQRYTISEAAKITGFRYQRIYYALQRGTIRNTTFAGGKHTRIRGIDLAIYALRNSHDQVFTDTDVAALFGVSRIDFNHLGIPPTPALTRSRNHYVFPMYDLIAEKAMKMFGR